MMMKKTVLIAIISFLVLSCVNKSSQKKTPDTSSDKSSSVENQSKIGRSNYAITWEWKSDDSNVFHDNFSTIVAELTDLWKEDVIENVYFDEESARDKLNVLGNIAFFLKAHSKDEVKVILDGLTIVKKGIAKYNIHSVGLLWLDRKTEVINQKGISKSFVTVWTKKGEINSDKILKEQNETMLELWNKGIIENVYFDIEGTQKPNEKIDFVFFVNAESAQEAKAICETIPFYANNIATYEIYQAGVFWLGKYLNQ